MKMLFLLLFSTCLGYYCQAQDFSVVFQSTADTAAAHYAGSSGGTPNATFGPDDNIQFYLVRDGGLNFAIGSPTSISYTVTVQDQNGAATQTASLPAGYFNTAVIGFQVSPSDRTAGMPYVSSLAKMIAVLPPAVYTVIITSSELHLSSSNASFQLDLTNGNGQYGRLSGLAQAGTTTDAPSPTTDNSNNNDKSSTTSDNSSVTTAPALPVVTVTLQNTCATDGQLSIQTSDFSEIRTETLPASGNINLSMHWGEWVILQNGDFKYQVPLQDQGGKQYRVCPISEEQQNALDFQARKIGISVLFKCDADVKDDSQLQYIYIDGGSSYDQVISGAPVSKTLYMGDKVKYCATADNSNCKDWFTIENYNQNNLVVNSCP